MAPEENKGRTLIKRAASIVATASHAVVIMGALVTVSDYPRDWVASVVDQHLAERDTALAGKLQQRLDEYSVRQGTISYFDTPDCPEHWSRATELSGRYVVATWEGERHQVGAIVGTPLGSMENRSAGQHTHHTKDVLPDCRSQNTRLLGGGSCGFSERQVLSNVGNDLKEDTNAPYVLLSACKKD